MYVLISSYRGVLFYRDFLPQIIAISVAVPSTSATKGSCVQIIQDLAAIAIFTRYNEQPYTYTTRGPNNRRMLL